MGTSARSYAVKRVGVDEAERQWGDFEVAEFVEIFYVASVVNNLPTKIIRPVEDVKALILIHLGIWPSQYISHAIAKVDDMVRLTVESVK